MVSGAHVVLYSSDPEADRVFFRDVLGFRFVDDGGGWLIFALPPSEVAVHPLSENGPAPVMDTGHKLLAATLHLMCEDLPSLMKSLKTKNVGCTEPSKQPWGTSTTVRLPSGGSIGLYQPTHKTPLGIGSMENFGASGG
jgi:glyoxalase/bleomycin resistance protein/dioxygenase superfamily protein